MVSFVYEVIFSPRARKGFSKLEKTLQARILAVLERIRIRPLPHLQKLVGSNAFKVRVGDYRILVDLNAATQQLIVLKIGHRRNVYNWF